MERTQRSHRAAPIEDRGPRVAADSLTVTEIALVRDSYDRVSVGRRFASKFYTRLFELEPDIRRLFPEDLSAQVTKLMEMLGALVDQLDRPMELARLLSDLGHRHREYGVDAAHFAPVGRALFETLAAELGPHFDESTRGAWIALYALAAGLMKQHIGEAGPVDRCAPSQANER